MKEVLIIDGQGGMLGKQMVEAVRKLIPDAQIIAVGTNVAATNSMLKAGADNGVVPRKISRRPPFSIMRFAMLWCLCSFRSWANSGRFSFHSKCART